MYFLKNKLYYNLHVHKSIKPYDFPALSTTQNYFRQFSL